MCLNGLIEMSDASGLANAAITIYVPIQMAFNAAVGWVAWKMKTDRQQITTLENRVHETTVKLIDERMRAISHEVKTHAQELVSTIDDMKSRLKEGDGRIHELGERDHGLELKMMKEILEFQRVVARDGVTRSDLEKHQESMGRALKEVRSEMLERLRDR
jgi:hypothetical protein